ncbi:MULTISPECIES: M23 family metallopeptidase [Burkholderia]|nr:MULTISPECIES: M23 family metallopeptidase [Burkholderia]
MNAYASAPYCNGLLPAYKTPADAHRVAFAHSQSASAMPKQVDAAPPQLRPPLRMIRATSSFGGRMHPIRGSWHEHNGIDLAAPTGTPVYAAAAGVVSRIATHRSYGKYVVVDHGASLETHYAHLSAFGADLRVGRRIAAGGYVGAVGQTGSATGPHLHFEVRRHGKPLDPVIVTAGLGGRLIARAETVARVETVRQC